MWGIAAVAVASAMDPLVVSRGPHTWTATGCVPPDLPEDTASAACRFQLRWTSSGMALDQTSNCAADVAPRAADTLASCRWTSTPGAPMGPVVEIWVLPGRRPDVPDHVAVVQSAAASLTLPAGVDAIPFHVVGRTFLQWPAAALEADTNDTSCDARVEVTSTGLVGNVTVEGCDALFRDAVDVGLRAWGFSPWSLEGLSVPSAVRLGVNFTRDVDDAMRPGVEVQLPPDAVFPESVSARVDASPPARREPPMPEGSPAFLVHEAPYAMVAVYQYPLPGPGLEPGVCPVRLGVNSRRQVWVWPDATCPEALRGTVEKTLGDWVMVPQTPRPGELYARFSFDVVVPEAGDPFVRMADPVYRSEDLVPGVHTVAAPRLLKQVMPRGDVAGSCTIDVTVAPSGRPQKAVAVACDSGLEQAALDAVQRWRWEPPRSDGEPTEWTTRVRIRGGG
jgi:TonB family protein